MFPKFSGSTSFRILWSFENQYNIQYSMLDQHATPKTNAQCLSPKIRCFPFPVHLIWSDNHKEQVIKMIKAAFNGLNSTKTDTEQSQWNISLWRAAKPFLRLWDSSGSLTDPFSTNGRKLWTVTVPQERKESLPDSSKNSQQFKDKLRQTIKEQQAQVDQIRSVFKIPY